ncbi:MAG: DUF3592 domain-containing protein [Anaerolineae bacterium]
MTNQPITFRRAFAKQGGFASILILILVIAAEIGAFAYGRLSSQLNREGIVTQATVLSIEQYEEVVLTDLLEETRRVNSNGSIVTVVRYEFQTETGETYTDEYKSKDLAIIPERGGQFELRYAESDPTLHEVRIGHLDSNVAALHWIAAFFAALTFGYILWAAFGAYRILNSTEEKRKRRLAELSKN